MYNNIDIHSIEFGLNPFSSNPFVSFISLNLFIHSSSSPSIANMKHFPPNFKQWILRQYKPDSRTQGSTALARFIGRKFASSTIRRWYGLWKGGEKSLERKKGSGRPRLLSREEATVHIGDRVRRANREHRAIHYTSLLPDVQRETGKKVSLRTLRRYGREVAGIRQRRTKKRKVDECRY